MMIVEVSPYQYNHITHRNDTDQPNIIVKLKGDRKIDIDNRMATNESFDWCWNIKNDFHTHTSCYNELLRYWTQLTQDSIKNMHQNSILINDRPIGHWKLLTLLLAPYAPATLWSGVFDADSVGFGGSVAVGVGGCAWLFAALRCFIERTLENVSGSPARLVGPSTLSFFAWSREQERGHMAGIMLLTKFWNLQLLPFLAYIASFARKTFNNMCQKLLFSLRIITFNAIQNPQHPPLSLRITEWWTKPSTEYDSGLSFDTSAEILHSLNTTRQINSIRHFYQWHHCVYHKFLSMVSFTYNAISFHRLYWIQAFST